MYILEGNIGAGKSTFLNLLAQERPHLSIALEPLDAWHTNAQGKSLLAHFYEHPARWAFTMETFAMACRVTEHLKEQALANTQRIVERSIYSGHYVFALNGYTAGFMTALEWELYTQTFNFLIQAKCNAPHGFIYVQTTPHIAYERIKKRKRSAENAISFDYIAQIHERHEAFLVYKKNLLPDLHAVPVLVIPCDEDFETNKGFRNACFNAVEEFIQKTHKGMIRTPLRRSPLELF